MDQDKLLLRIIYFLKRKILNEMEWESIQMKFNIDEKGKTNLQVIYLIDNLENIVDSSDFYKFEDSVDNFFNYIKKTLGAKILVLLTIYPDLNYEIETKF